MPEPLGVLTTDPRMCWRSLGTIPRDLGSRLSNNNMICGVDRVVDATGMAIFLLGSYNDSACTAKPNKPSGVKATALSEDSLIIRWYKPLPDQYDVSFYCFQTGTYPKGVDSTTTFGPVATEQRNNLLPGTSYDISVSFQCSQNSSMSGKMVLFKASTLAHRKLLFSFVFFPPKIDVNQFLLL